MLVNVTVYVPENLSGSEKSAIESLKESPNFIATPAQRESIFSKFKQFFERNRE